MIQKYRPKMYATAGDTA